jgi:hypothetical protein
MSIGFELILLHLTADFVLQTTWMATKKHTSLWAAIVHGAVYTAPFLLVSIDPFVLFTLFWTHTIIDHYRIASVVPRFTNWSWTDWTWHGWLDYRSYNPNAQPSYFSGSLMWLNIAIDQILHLWIIYWVF